MVGQTLYFGSDGLKQNYLFALAAEDGKVRWRFPTPTQVFSTPAVRDGTVYFHARHDHVYAVDAADGRLIWKSPAPNPQDEFSVFADMAKSSPAVGDGRVFVGIGRDLVALDVRSGTESWRSTAGGRVDSSPLLVGNTVYVGSDDRSFYAFDAGSGARVWEFATGGKVSSSPAAFGDLLLIGSNDGYLYAFAERSRVHRGERGGE